MFDFNVAFEALVHWEPKPPDLERIEDLQEDLSVELLYLAEAMRGLAILFGLLRNQKVWDGFLYTQQPMNSRNINGIEVSVFENREDSE